MVGHFEQEVPELTIGTIEGVECETFVFLTRKFSGLFVIQIR